MKRILCAALMALFLCGCAPKETSVQKTVFAMDTVMDLKLWGSDCQGASEEIETLLQDLERRWSSTREDSAVGLMNRGLDPSLTGQEQTLVERVLALKERTGGAFDPKLRSVSAAWGFLSGEYRVPDAQQIAHALSDPKWDLGAAMKGYAGDQAVELLKTRNVDRAVLNLGGNIQTYGEKPDGTPWQIAIQNPAGEGTAGIVSVRGTASIVTSGSYQRFFEENGVRYHHIMDGDTGRPANSGLLSVTVICANGLTADALSTALFVMGLEEGAELWRESDDFEAVFILEDGRVYATEGACLSGCEYEVITRENKILGDAGRPASAP